MPTEKPHTDQAKPTLLIQVLCIFALVFLSAIDAWNKDFQVSNIVYAIIAGILFGIGNVKNIIGGGK